MCRFPCTENGFAMFRACFTLTAISIVSLTVGESVAVTFDFEDVTVGTVYGNSAGNVPGDVVLTKDGVTMSVERFNTGISTPFNNATVRMETFPPGVNETHTLNTSNINAKFDFTALP